MGTDGRSPAWVRRVYVANLVAQGAIIVTGAIVRITGSGLGCPTWPECAEGSYIPTATQAEAWHKYVEFGNRLLTFVLAALAIAAVIAALADARRRRAADLPPRPVLTVLAVVPLAGTVLQAVLGGITVLTGLHPTIVAAHFLVSIALVAACVALVARSGEPGDQPIVWTAPRPVVVLTYALIAVGLAVVILGVIVTGSGPHSGDAETEARFSFDPRTVSWLHADAVFLFLGLIIGVIVAASLNADLGTLRRRALILAGIAGAQGVVGYTQYFTGLPELLVGIHVLGAVATWVALLFLAPALRTRGLSPAEERIHAYQ
ncbi:MAG: heme A synthase [Actinobacteria bacterium]|nr:heme A synthase [Actinomycetota bacterium]